MLFLPFFFVLAIVMSGGCQLAGSRRPRSALIKPSKTNGNRMVGMPLLMAGECNENHAGLAAIDQGVRWRRLARVLGRPAVAVCPPGLCLSRFPTRHLVLGSPPLPLCSWQ